MLSHWRRIPGPPRDPLKARLLRLHRTLREQFGRPAPRLVRPPFEIAVGAMLARPIGETNVERVLTSLRRARLRSPRALARIDERRLATVIRAAGASRADARRLKAFARWLLQKHGGRFDGLRRQPLSSLRASLLAVPGLGPETADAILLYAAHRPVFVADALTRRALAGHGVLRAPATYENARRLVEAHLPSDPALFRNFHALLVAAGQARRTLKRRRR